MKKIILIFVLLLFTRLYSQKYFQKRKLVSIDGISIMYDTSRLKINVETNKPVHFQLWNNDKIVLNATGIAKGEESFPVSKGKYKFILFDKKGNSKNKCFRI